MMLISLKCFQYLNVIGMPQALQYVYLIHNLLLLAFLLHEVHVDALDGDKLPGQPVQAQVDLAEGALSKHLAYLV